MHRPIDKNNRFTKKHAIIILKTRNDNCHNPSRPLSAMMHPKCYRWYVTDRAKWVRDRKDPHDPSTCACEGDVPRAQCATRAAFIHDDASLVAGMEFMFFFHSWLDLSTGTLTSTSNKFWYDLSDRFHDPSRPLCARIGYIPGIKDVFYAGDIDRIFDQFPQTRSVRGEHFRRMVKREITDEDIRNLPHSYDAELYRYCARHLKQTTLIDALDSHLTQHLTNICIEYM